MEKNKYEIRNQKIIEFFKFNEIFNIRIYGNKITSSIIINNDICLSCYINNNKLILTDKPFQSNKLLYINLNDLYSYKINLKSQKIFENWLYTCEHRAIYTIYFWLNLNFNTDYIKHSERLFIINFKDDIPIFSSINPKIYFSLEKAKEIVEKFSTNNIKLLITNIK